MRIWQPGAFLIRGAGVFYHFPQNKTAPAATGAEMRV
jgi:hypothetical protein